MDPSFVFAFLRTFLDILQEYLGDVTAGTIRENFDTVYQARHCTHIGEMGTHRRLVVLAVRGNAR